ncbi:BRO family protein [Clostridium beijerinckii]|uniref:BRO family protein n=1 Tax=Clostridium beijerinckii TaxID=1520 RepID=UPI00156F23BB
MAAALGYSNTRDALATHVDEEDKNTVAISDGKRGNPNQVIINESGLYSLIFGSKLESVKQFKKWVTNEVLPTIRKTGGYVNNSKQFTDK